MASLQDAVCVSFDGPVVSLRSTTGYRLGSLWDQVAEAVRRSLPIQRVTDTARLARLNLAVRGLSGDIKQGNTYYEDLQDSVGRFDFVLANPPFNVSKIDKERLAGDPRTFFAHHSSLRLRTAGASKVRMDRWCQQSGAGWEAGGGRDFEF